MIGYILFMKIFKRHGFTLVEIIIVVAIIGLLAVVGIPYVLNAFNNSKNQVKARNVAEVEKAKQILALPEAAKISGAMGLESELMDIQKNSAALSNLCAALRINSLEELMVGGDTISVGSLKSKASY